MLLRSHLFQIEENKYFQQLRSINYVNRYIVFQAVRSSHLNNAANYLISQSMASAMSARRFHELNLMKNHYYKAKLVILVTCSLVIS